MAMPNDGCPTSTPLIDDWIAAAGEAAVAAEIEETKRRIDEGSIQALTILPTCWTL